MTTSEHGGTEKVSPSFAYSIAFLRNIWYNINNLNKVVPVADENRGNSMATKNQIAPAV